MALTVSDLRDAERRRERARSITGDYGSVYDLHKQEMGEQSDEAARVELIGLVDKISEDIGTIMDRAKGIAEKLVSTLSPQARASLKIQGRDNDAAMNDALETKSQIGKRLAVIEQRLRRSALAKSASAVTPELQKMRVHMAEIASGRRVVDADVRKKLRLAISAAEIMAAEAS